MSRSLPVLRQGTFDTGPAQVDVKGNIRRGGIQIPVVDDSLTHAPHPDCPDRSDPLEPASPDRQQSLARKALPASATEFQTASPRKPTAPEGQRSPPDDKSQPQANTQEHSAKGTNTEVFTESPRYLDHNALYDESPSLPSPQESSVKLDIRERFDSGGRFDTGGRFDIGGRFQRQTSAGAETVKEKPEAPESKFPLVDKDTLEADDNGHIRNSQPAVDALRQDESEEHSSFASQQKHAHRSAENIISKHANYPPRTKVLKSTHHIHTENVENNVENNVTVTKRAPKTSLALPGTDVSDNPPAGEPRIGNLHEKTFGNKRILHSRHIPADNSVADKSKIQKELKSLDTGQDSTRRADIEVSNLQIKNVSAPSDVSARSKQPVSQQAREGKPTGPSYVVTRLLIPVDGKSITGTIASGLETVAELSPRQNEGNSFTRKDSSQRKTAHIETKAAEHEHVRAERVKKPSERENEVSKPCGVHAERTVEAKQPVTRKGSDRFLADKQDRRDKRRLWLAPGGQTPQSKSNMADSRTPLAGGQSLKEVSSERDQLLRAEKTYRQRIRQLEEEVKAAVKQSQELSAENIDLRSKLEALEHGRTSAGILKLQDLRREKDELVSTVARVTKDKLEVDAENHKLKASTRELEKRVQDLENEARRLQDKGQPPAQPEHAEQLTAALNENKKLQAEATNLRAQNTALEKEVARQESLNADLSQRLEQKRTELDELVRVLKSDETSESQINDLKSHLETAQNKLSEHKANLDDINNKYQELEREHAITKAALKTKEAECKGLKSSLEEKDGQISELRRKLDSAKRGAKKLEETVEDLKQTEKDAVNMKARVKSLKNEIEDSLAAIHRLKQEHNEANVEVDRLNGELAATGGELAEARRCIKRLESERDAWQKAGDELQAREKREGELERQVFELNVRNDQLKQKAKELEEDKQDLLKARSNATELEAANRKLQEENQKLRQVLVERNIEIARRQSDRNTLVTRVEKLERKQNDADIQMQQLKGWVSTSHVTSGAPLQDQRLSTRKDHLLGLPHLAARPLPRESQAAGAGGNSKRRRQEQKVNRSWDDLTRLGDQDVSAHTSPSLPVALDTRFLDNPPSFAPSGYFELYRQKQNLIKARRW